jgi:hypothetical protein
MSSGYCWNFPSPRRRAGVDGVTRGGMADGVADAVARAVGAARDGAHLDYIMSLLSCVQACEAALREFSDDSVGTAHRRVVEKGIASGLYDCVAERGGADAVDHPSHYLRGDVEAIEVIEGVLDGIHGEDAYNLGNVLKYALRAGSKGPAHEDIAKANNYAHRALTGEWRWEH